MLLLEQLELGQVEQSFAPLEDGFCAYEASYATGIFIDVTGGR